MRKKPIIEKKTLSTSTIDLGFPERIACKYSIFRKVSNLPMLIFFRLFGTRGIKTITNIHMAELMNSYPIINVSLYFNMIHKMLSLDFPGIDKKGHFFVPALWRTLVESIALENKNTHQMNSLSIFQDSRFYFTHLNMLPFLWRGKGGDLGIQRGIREIISRNNKHILNSPASIQHDSEYVRNKVFLENQVSNYFQKFLNQTVLRNTELVLALRTYPWMLMNKHIQGESIYHHYDQGDYHYPLTVLQRIGTLPESNAFFRNKFKRDTSHPPVTQRNIYKVSDESVYFHKQQKIEQEVEQIKKITMETKEVVLEKSMSDRSRGDVDIKKHLDINRISDQVYQNIERRIRIEKERRGL